MGIGEQLRLKRTPVFLFGKIGAGTPDVLDILGEVNDTRKVDPSMIARVWKGCANSEKVRHYVEHFEQSVFPELSQINGYQGATILRRDLDDGVELTVITLWESMDAIRRFAGEQVETAVVAPAARAILRSFDTAVTHYEVLLQK